MIKIALWQKKKGVHVSPLMFFLTLLFLNGSLFFGVYDLNAQSYTIETIEVVGNDFIDAETVISHADVEVGVNLTAAQLNRIFQNLQNSNLFERIALTPKGKILIIEIQEYPTINDVRFEGNQRIKDKTLKEIARSTNNLVFNPALAEEDARNIATTYAQIGRLNTTVDPVIIPRAGNRVDLVFEILETAVIETERIAFIGNRNFTDVQLRRILHSKQAGIFSTFIRQDVFSEQSLLLDEKLLTDFYTQRGFIDFRVKSSVGELTSTQDAFFITFNIVEGQRFKIGKIDVVSDIEDIDTSAFRALSRVEEGEYFNQFLVDNTVMRMKNLALKESIDFLRVESRLTRNEETLTVDLEYILTRGPRVFIERINIQGNVTTFDRVIRKEFNVVEGDPFSPDEIRVAADRIRALGFFDKVDVTQRQGSTAGKIIIDVEIEEKPTGRFSFGVGYSNVDGVGFAASVQENNYLGRGQTFGFGVSFLREKKSLNVRFYEPFLLGRDVGLGLSLNLSKTKRQKNARYSYEEIFFRPDVSYPIFENTRLKLQLNLGNYVFSDVPETNSPILKSEEGYHQRFGFGYSVSFDNSSQIGIFKDGHLLRLSQNLQGLGYKDTILNNKLYYLIERNFGERDFGFKFDGEVGWIIPLRGTTVLPDRYFLDTSQIRGFYPGTISPRDFSVDDNDTLGGEKYFAIRSELKFPLGLPSEYNIVSSAFFDIGSVWSLPKAQSFALDDGTKIEVDDTMKIRQSVGVSLVWETLIGPLRFNFARPLKKYKGDETLDFEFKIESIF